MTKGLLFTLFLMSFGLLKSQNDSICTPKKWQFNGGYFIGCNIFTKDLKTDYTNQIAGGIFFDFYFKKVFLSLRDHIGFGLTNREFKDTTIILPRRSNFRSFLGEADIGFVVYDKEKIKLTPFVGISSFWMIQPLFHKSSTPYSDNFGLPFTTTYSFGLNFDYKYSKAKWKSENGERIKTSQYKFVRVRNAFFFPQLTKGLKGNIYCLTIDFGFD